MTVLILTLTGSAGAAARYLVTGIIQERTRSLLPLGTAVVNIAGAFALGLVIGASPERLGNLSLAAVGFMGGFTTFSTWMVESLRLGLVPRPSLRSVANLGLLAALGIAAAALGYHMVN